MRLSVEGLQFIRQQEGCRLQAYQDQGGVWTIGYGCTAGVIRGDTLTQEQADNLLNTTLVKYEFNVSSATTQPLLDHEFTALVSFAYNVGLHAFRTSTLLSKLNLGDKTGAAEEFLVWDRVNGIINIGLVRRRQREKALFLYGHQV